MLFSRSDRSSLESSSTSEPLQEYVELWRSLDRSLDSVHQSYERGLAELYQNTAQSALVSDNVAETSNEPLVSQDAHHSDSSHWIQELHHSSRSKGANAINTASQFWNRQGFTPLPQLMSYELKHQTPEAHHTQEHDESLSEPSSEPFNESLNEPLSKSLSESPNEKISEKLHEPITRWDEESLEDRLLDVHASQAEIDALDSFSSVAERLMRVQEGKQPEPTQGPKKLHLDSSRPESLDELYKRSATPISQERDGFVFEPHIQQIETDGDTITGHVVNSSTRYHRMGEFMGAPERLQTQNDFPWRLVLIVCLLSILLGVLLASHLSGHLSGSL